MKKMFLLLVLAFSFSANASLLIEPYFGMALNGTVENDKTGLDEDYSGSSYGARLGWQSLGLQLGADYRMHNHEYEVSSTDVEVSNSGIYGFIGYEFPVMIRIYGEMAFAGSGEVDFGGTTTELEGFNSTVLGLSYTGLPFVALNFEMVNMSYDEDEDGDDVDNEWSHYLLSVSLPINL